MNTRATSSRCGVAAIAEPPVSDGGTYSPVIAVIDATPLEVARESLAATYKATRSHRALMRLRDATHAALMAGIEGGKT